MAIYLCDELFQTSQQGTVLTAMTSFYTSATWWPNVAVPCWLGRCVDGASRCVGSEVCHPYCSLCVTHPLIHWSPLTSNHSWVSKEWVEFWTPHHTGLYCICLPSFFALHAATHFKYISLFAFYRKTKHILFCFVVT